MPGMPERQDQDPRRALHFPEPGLNEWDGAMDSDASQVNATSTIKAPALLPAGVALGMEPAGRRPDLKPSQTDTPEPDQQ